MTVYGETQTLSVPVPARGARLSAAVRVAVRWIGTLGRAMAHRRDMALLCTLDDHMLRDIGIDRGDLDDAISAAPWRDPSQVLVARAVERRAAHFLRLRAASRARGRAW